MTRRQVVLLLMLVLVALVLAPVGKYLVEALLITPLSDAWWLVKIVLLSFNQGILWVVFLFIIATATLILTVSIFPRSKGKKIATNPPPGPVEALAKNITHSKKGTYFKWEIANHLAHLSLDILKRRNGEVQNQKRSFDGLDWEPPKEVETYLEAGLNSSFMDYRKQNIKTPFDLELEKVVNYLESLLETNP